MMKRFVPTLTAAAFLMAGGGLFSLRAEQPEGRIHQRKENQQARIANGVGKGSLTAKETSHLEHREAGLNREIHNDRVQNGGKLTNQEKRQVNRQQNRLSRSIYRDKHNARRQAR